MTTTTKCATLPAAVTANAGSRLSVTSPATNCTKVSGQITVNGQTQLTLDSAGTYLMVDGVEVGTHRVRSGPYQYGLDTTTLTNGSHVLQLWGHDIGNNTWISSPVTVSVSN